MARRRRMGRPASHGMTAGGAWGSNSSPESADSTNAKTKTAASTASQAPTPATAPMASSRRRFVTRSPNCSAKLLHQGDATRVSPVSSGRPPWTVRHRRHSEEPAGPPAEDRQGEERVQGEELPAGELAQVDLALPADRPQRGEHTDIEAESQQRHGRDPPERFARTPEDRVPRRRVMWSNSSTAPSAATTGPIVRTASTGAVSPSFAPAATGCAPGRHATSRSPASAAAACGCAAGSSPCHR